MVGLTSSPKAPKNRGAESWVAERFAATVRIATVCFAMVRCVTVRDAAIRFHTVRTVQIVGGPRAERHPAWR